MNKVKIRNILLVHFLYGAGSQQKLAVFSLLSMSCWAVLLQFFIAQWFIVYFITESGRIFTAVVTDSCPSRPERVLESTILRSVALKPHVRATWSVKTVKTLFLLWNIYILHLEAPQRHKRKRPVRLHQSGSTNQDMLQLVKGPLALLGSTPVHTFPPQAIQWSAMSAKYGINLWYQPSKPRKCWFPSAPVINAEKSQHSRYFNSIITHSSNAITWPHNLTLYKTNVCFIVVTCSLKENVQNEQLILNQRFSRSYGRLL